MKRKLSILTILLTSMTLLLTGCGKKEIIENTHVSTPIYSLQTGVEVKGSFVYGAGVVNGNVKYYVYVPDGNGHILKSYDADKTIIVEEDNGKPRVEEDYVIKKVKASLFDDILYSGILQKQDGYYAFPECTRRVMYLPKNTIKQEYSTSISK